MSLNTSSEQVAVNHCRSPSGTSHAGIGECKAGRTDRFAALLIIGLAAFCIGRSWWMVRHEWRNLSSDTKKLYLVVAPALTPAVDVLEITDRIFWRDNAESSQPHAVVNDAHSMSAQRFVVSELDAAEGDAFGRNRSARFKVSYPVSDTVPGPKPSTSMPPSP